MRRTLSFIAILILVLGLIVFVASPALALPLISVSPSSGPRGSTITVSGTGFEPGDVISVTFDGASVTSAVASGAAGSATWSATFTVPSSATAGSHTVAALRGTPPVSVATAPFNIPAAAISLNRSSGSPGSGVTVSGTGFAVNESGITVTFDGNPVGPATSANAQGSWNSVFAVPVSASGSHNVGAYGPITQASSVATVGFYVSAGVSLSPVSGAPGSSISVSGIGFGAGETGITVTFDGNPVGPATSANAQGAFISTFTVPAAPSGPHRVGVYGSVTLSGSVSDITFTVGPGLSLGRATGAPGTSVTVNGSGFAANETGITITYDGTPVASGISANAQGAWTGSFTVPVSASGSHGVGAYGSSTQAGSVSQTAFTVSAGISVNRATGAPGTSVTVTGSGFGAGETGITVTFDDTPVYSGITANSRGGWTATFSVPPSAFGPHSIAAYGSTTHASSVGTASFTVAGGITLSRTSGAPGTSLTVSGTGFGAGETGITVTYDGNPVASGITANSQGAWSTSFAIPPSASGPHSIRAYGSITQGSSVPEATLNVGASISPSRMGGAPGSSLTVSGSGFGAGETGITVTYDGSPVASGIPANLQGAWSATFTIPPSASGAHVIRAYGLATQPGTAGDINFTVVGGITLSRTSGAPGNPITITGSGFAGNETGITVTYDGNLVASGISANAQGGWSANFSLPASPSGTHIFRAYGGTTQAGTVGDVNFTVVGGITLSRTSGAPGSAITVTGSGFAASEAGITVTFDGTTVASGITANAQGGWSTNFTIPASASGTHSVKAYGSVTQTASAPEATLTTSAGISANRTSGSPGNSVTVTGSGFGAGETGITVVYDGTPVALGISANAQGAWNAAFTIPPSVFGPHSIKSYGSTTQAASVGELGFSIIPAVSLNPASGHVGIKVDITGFGFAPNSSLRLTYDDTEVPDEGATTDASGGFSKSISVPKSKAGAHTIRVVDGQKNESKASYAMESTPPHIPSLLSPKDSARLGILGGVTPTLKWASVADPSGVTYTLQVDTSADFPQPILEKADLSSPSYTLTKAEALPRGEYYWRVKATDTASNQSAWSQPWLLKSGLMALWTLLVILVLGVVVVGGAIYYLLVRLPLRRRVAVPVPEPGLPMLPALPGYWREVEPEEAKPRALPWRRALPQPTKTVKTISPEEQARLKVIADFAQSLPLVEPGYNVDWIVDLVETAMGIKVSQQVYERLLQGQLPVRYEPAWTGHPLCQELRGLLDGQPIVQDLDGFVGAVDRCASDGLLLLQEVHRDTTAEVPSDLLGRGGWGFISAVYSDAMGWFRGKSLREPSERDYTVKAAGPGEGTGAVWLYGEESTSFAGPLIQALDEKEALQLRALHMRLRRTYRNSDRARQLVNVIAQLEVQRNRLTAAFGQLGRFAEGG